MTLGSCWSNRVSDVVLRKTIERVGWIEINRPDALNALNDEVMDGIGAAVGDFEKDSNVGCIVLTGNERAFAAGADVAYMRDFDFPKVYKDDFITKNWERIREARKPVLAAVSGYALGGGCELAMMCDLIFASDTARFGQPEIKIGTMPGAGGTQRLPRLIGKAKAMDLCLTARMIDAAEAERWGIVARVYPSDRLLDETLAAAKLIASYSLPVAMMVKESINRAYESSLSEGLLFERRAFHSTFALEDQKEGMSAFLSKRRPTFKHR